MGDNERGTFRCYVPKVFKPDALHRIGQANVIIEQFEAQGYQMTLRQLYYQLVAKNVIPNSKSEYDKLGSLLSDARLAGLVSWTALEDRQRFLSGYTTYIHPGQAVAGVANGYKRDLWEDQRWRPEVWVEKDAMADVVGQICSKLRVNFVACRGYMSQSTTWRAGRRMVGYIAKGQRPIVFHLGDHDPSGIDMTRDNTERLTLFAGTQVMVVRIALNRDQVDRYQPPPNPAKVSDSRYENYQREHGDESWEMDALDPSVISDLIEQNVLKLRDHGKWSEALRREAVEKQVIKDAAEELGGNDEDEEPDETGEGSVE